LDGVAAVTLEAAMKSWGKTPPTPERDTRWLPQPAELAGLARTVGVPEIGVYMQLRAAMSVADKSRPQISPEDRAAGVAVLRQVAAALSQAPKDRRSTAMSRKL
jgi:hypothetical protein